MCHQNDVTSAMEDAIQEMQRRHHLFPLPVPSFRETGQLQGADTRDVDTQLAHHLPIVVVVAVSGGADSVCLLHLLRRLTTEWPLALHVAHLDHALRPDSAADATFVAQLAQRWGLPFHHRRLTPGELAADAASLESAARHARQQFLAEVAVHCTPVGQTPTVALGHHGDDQAETVLHRLVRGSGLQGLMGMRPVTELTVASGCAATLGTASFTIAESSCTVIHLVRPLLYVRRATILQYLQTHGLAWREDSTNQDQRYTRNYIRHTVMPALTQLNPAVVEAIGRMATVVQEDVSRLAAYDREMLAKVQLAPPLIADPEAAVSAEPPARTVLDLDALRLLPAPTQRALLRMALARLTPTQGELSFAHVDALVAALACAVSGGPHPLVGNLAWSVAGATATLPTRLSLHRTDTLPFLPDHLLLAVGQQVVIPTVAMGETVYLEPAGGRQLVVTLLPRRDLPPEWRSNNQPWRAFFDADRVKRPVLTTPTVGQQFAPLGMGGQQKALGDFFTDRKIPVTLRKHWPVLVDAASGTLLWVCGLQMAHPARITDRTERVLWISIK